MLPRIETNSVQQFSALNAFKSNQNVTRPDSEQVDVSEGVNTTSAKTLLDRIDVNEVRECAKTVGEFNISDDDIINLEIPTGQPIVYDLDENLKVVDKKQL